ncbi:MAG: DUF1214 domain-containing protein [Gemmatimonadales bacterium]|nr:DUF1214 domain-containing protein [Gemmatimonadales bacterium]MYC88486.1 DUF1214 domain-containing protein [Candidatus Palauibacter denitrificans]MYE68530.1 DUF1214 domain-containing protein [Gemmatimonadota bacterium]
MRKFVIGLIGLFRRLSLAAQKLRGRTPADIAAQRVVSGKAWDEFCDTLKAAGAALTFPGAPRDPFNQSEGYRYLSRLARGGLMAFVEHADPRAPVLHRVAHETVKLGSDNPDNYYQTAAIRGDFEYRISGRRNTVTYLGFGTQAGHYGQSGGLPPTGYIEAGEIETGDDGTFDLIVSRRRHDGNWLPMTAESRTLIVRQTFLDRETEVPAELHIERIGCGEDEKRPRPLTPEQIDEGLKSAGTLVAGASMLFANWARGFRRHSNTLPMFDPDVSLQAGGDPNIVYYHSHWAVADDEALLIEAMPPECEHWNFQLNNYWMESLDYRYHTIHTNKHLAHQEEDGSIRLVVCHEDPGLPNWLETAGHTSGTMCFRWVRAKEHPQPRTRLVKLAELRALREA